MVIAPVLQELPNEHSPPGGGSAKPTGKFDGGGGWGHRPGAVDENRGPHPTSALLIPPSERLRCTDFDPLAGPPSHFLPSAASSPSAPACWARFEKVSPHASHLGSDKVRALASFRPRAGNR